MGDGRRFEAGEAVAWRSSWPGRESSYVFAGRVLADADDRIVLHQPHGAPLVRRDAVLGGPRNRLSLQQTPPGPWRLTTWDGPSTVRFHPVGRPYSIIREWHAGEGSFHGWYVNIEVPWRRTDTGFDSRDQILDVQVSSDRSSWRFKDEDELTFAEAEGLFSPTEVAEVRDAAATAIADLEAAWWPFQDEIWDALLPVADDGLPDLPSGWHRIVHDQVRALMLAASPSFATVWDPDDNLDDDGTPLLYTDASDLCRHLDERRREGIVDELPAVFALIERLHIAGDGWVRNLATIGFLESLQIYGDAFEPWLRPATARWWDRLNRYWQGEGDSLNAPDPDEEREPPLSPDGS